jgi:hypothetical protein
MLLCKSSLFYNTCSRISASIQEAFYQRRSSLHKRYFGLHEWHFKRHARLHKWHLTLRAIVREMDPYRGASLIRITHPHRITTGP